MSGPRFIKTTPTLCRNVTRDVQQKTVAKSQITAARIGARLPTQQFNDQLLISIGNSAGKIGKHRRDNQLSNCQKYRSRKTRVKTKEVRTFINKSSGRYAIPIYEEIPFL